MMLSRLCFIETTIKKIYSRFSDSVSQLVAAHVLDDELAVVAGSSARVLVSPFDVHLRSGVMNNPLGIVPSTCVVLGVEHSVVKRC